MSLFRYPWFPYLFALGMPLTLYSHNQAAFAGNDVVRPVIVFLLAAALLVAVLRRIVANRVVADVLATVPLLGVWLLGFGWPLLGLIAAWLTGCSLLRERNLPDASVSVLNALAIGVIFLPAFTIFQVERIASGNWAQRIPYSPFSAMTAEQLTDKKPDIYHIVLDAYAGGETLAGDLGFDNSGFFNELRRLGFLVNESITVPYNETVHTMSAIFLGEYLREGQFPIDSAFSPQLRSTLGALIVKGPVQETLRNSDYSIVFTDPGHEFLRFPGDAAILWTKSDVPLNRFEQHMAITSGLTEIFPSLYEVSDEDPLIRSVKNAFKHDFSEFTSPKFAYQHVLAPHTPFTIDRNGATTTAFPGFTNTAEGDMAVQGDPGRRQVYVEGYLEKLRFVNAKLLEQLATLSALPGKKIIIVHGDHGSGSKYWLDDPERTCLRERFTTFLAIYADDPELLEELSWVPGPEAAPVNIYRSVFNQLLDLELDLLPGESSFVRFSAPHQILPLDPERIGDACR